MTAMIPNCSDFMYGFDCYSYIDDDFVQYNIFSNENQKLVLSIDSLNSMNLKLYTNEYLTVEICDERVNQIAFGQTSLKITFDDPFNAFDVKYCLIDVASHFEIRFITM